MQGLILDLALDKRYGVSMSSSEVRVVVKATCFLSLAKTVHIKLSDE